MTRQRRHGGSLQRFAMLLGTDASAPGMFPGKSAHVELQELVAAGLTPFEALTAGTANAGRFAETRLMGFAGGTWARFNGTALRTWSCCAGIFWLTFETCRSWKA